MDNTDLAQKALDIVLSQATPADLVKIEKLIGKRRTYIEKQASHAIKRQFLFGAIGEVIAAAVLIMDGRNVRWSSTSMNKYRDVDLYANDIPISVKSKGHKYFDSNVFLFELERFCSVTNKWSDSWYYTTKAQAFVTVVYHASGGVKIYWLDKGIADGYVNQFGFDFTRGLKPETLKQQQGHKQVDTRNGFIQMSNIRHHVLFTNVEATCTASTREDF